MEELKIRHNEAIMMLNYKIAKVKNVKMDVIELGRHFVNLGLDMMFDGFWIWDLQNEIEYYSPKFKKVLGFSEEDNFPYVPESWQKLIDPNDAKKALIAFEKHKSDQDEPYYLPVTYTTKSGGKTHLVCAGTIVNRGNPDNLIMMGTHQLI